MTEPDALDQSLLPQGVRARFVERVNGLRVHLLEAGFEQPGRPMILLLARDITCLNVEEIERTRTIW